MEFEVYESMGKVTPIEEEEPIALLHPTSYHLGSGVPHNLRYAQKTLPTYGGVKRKKKNLRLRVHGVQSFTTFTRTMLPISSLNPMHEAFRAT